MTEHCEIWEPVQGIVSPCADISFNYEGPEMTSIAMHFSRVRGRPKQDLLLKFSGVISLRWESEMLSLNALPKPLPKCETEKLVGWTFPLLKVLNSSWLELHRARHPIAAERREHFVLTSMNDLVQLIALPEVKAEWVSLVD